MTKQLFVCRNVCCLLFGLSVACAYQSRGTRPLTLGSRQQHLLKEKPFQQWNSQSLQSRASLRHLAPSMMMGGSFQRGRSSTSSTPLPSLRDRWKPIPQGIVDAVGAQNQLSARDASALSGLDLLTSRTELMRLSSLTGCDMHASLDGNVIYTFPSNFKTLLHQNSVGHRVSAIKESLMPTMAWLVKFGFGLTLFTSLTFVWISLSTLFKATIGREMHHPRRSGRRHRRNPPRRNMRQGRRRSLDDYDDDDDDDYEYDDHGNTYSDDAYDRFDTRRGVSDRRFISLPKLRDYAIIFSFVFGPGNPNKNFAKEQMRTVATVVAKRKGIVLAEELAPLLTPPAINLAFTKQGLVNTGNDDVVVDESWLLPAMLQLGGEPIVTEDGDILYHFPSTLKDSNDNSRPERGGGDFVGKDLSNRKYVDSSDEPDEYLSLPLSPLQETLIPFSNCTTEETFYAASLGVLNAAGLALVNHLLPPLYGWARVAQVFANIYATVYLTVPVMRSIFTRRANTKIKERNSRREKWWNWWRQKSETIVRKSNARKKLLA